MLSVMMMREMIDMVAREVMGGVLTGVHQAHIIVAVGQVLTMAVLAVLCMIGMMVQHMSGAVVPSMSDTAGRYY